MDAARSAIGDYLRAVHRLGLAHDRPAREALATMFGLELIESTEDAKMPGREKPPDEEPQEPLPHRPPEPEAPRRPTPPTLPATVRRMTTDPDAEPPEWLRNADPLPRSTTTRTIPPKASLLEPQWSRAILTTVLATPGETSDIQLDQVIGHFVNFTVPRRLPVRLAPTLSRGAYCWVDQSPAMQPFTADQAQIIVELRNAVGSLRLDVRPTKGTPLRVTGLVPCVPHMVLSDLGARRVEGEAVHDSIALWTEWAASIERELETRVIAFVPAAPENYPLELRRVCRLVPWDRGTVVQTVRRALEGLDV